MTERDIDLMRRNGMAIQIRGLLLEIRAIEARHELKPLVLDRDQLVRGAAVPAPPPQCALDDPLLS